MPEITLGLIADTHVPDRLRSLHPRILPIFREAQVSAILHAGDVCIPRVLRELEELAPVFAVRGNRDLFGFKDLPLARELEYGGVRIGLAHGHLGFRRALLDRLRFQLYGPKPFEWFAQRVTVLFPDVDVVVFGHTHDPMVSEDAGRLVVNPGSACCPVVPGKPPSVGLLHIRASEVKAEIIFLD